MTLDDAIFVLNHRQYETKSGWHWVAENGRALLSTVNDTAVSMSLSPTEAIAIAAHLERIAVIDMPETRRLLKRLADEARHQDKAGKACGYEWAEMASMIRRDELEAALAEWGISQ